MAVQVLEFQGFPTMPRPADDRSEVFSSSLQSVQRLVNLLSYKQILNAQDPCLLELDAAAEGCRKTMSLFGGLGHARYRRAPGCRRSSSSPPISSSPLFQSAPFSASCDPREPQARSQSECRQGDSHAEPHSVDPKLTWSPCNTFGSPDEIAHQIENLSTPATVCRDVHGSQPCDTGAQNVDGSVYDATATRIFQHNGRARCRDFAAADKSHYRVRSIAEPDPAECSLVKANSSFVSSLSNEDRGGTVSSGKLLYSSARPPLPPKKRKLVEKDGESKRKCHKSGQCHCIHKRRKLHSSTEVRVVRLPADAMNSALIPDDGHSWSVYGRKRIDGSTYPRVYYKCSSVRGCPARKHVQCDFKDDNILIVTYGRSHTHPSIQNLAKTCG